MTVDVTSPRPGTIQQNRAGNVPRTQARPVRGLLLVLLGLGIGAGAAYFYLARTDQPPAVEAPQKTKEAAKEPERPPGAVAMSGASIAATGIGLERAGPAVLREELRLNGNVQANQERVVLVTPRFPGIVRDVRKRIGDRVEKGDVLAVVESNQSLTSYELRAPIAGTVIDRQITLGEYASEQKAALTVADLSTVWVDLAVYQRDFSRISVGQPVVIDLGDGGPPVESRITYVAPVGASTTQSSLARAVVENKDGRLRPGLFVTGRVLLSEKRVPVAVQSSALQTVDQRSVVFVRTGDGFMARPVATGEQDPARVEIRAGLRAGEEYAAANSFVVKAELEKGSAE